MPDSAEKPQHYFNPEMPDIPPDTLIIGMLTGEGHAVEYYVVPPESPSLRGQIVNSYIPRDLSRLVVSKDLKDRATDGPNPTQSSAMHQFLHRRENDRRRAAAKRGKPIPSQRRNTALRKGDLIPQEAVEKYITEVVRRILDEAEEHSA